MTCTHMLNGWQVSMSPCMGLRPSLKSLHYRIVHDPCWLLNQCKLARSTGRTRVGAARCLCGGVDLVCQRQWHTTIIIAGSESGGM